MTLRDYSPVLRSHMQNELRCQVKLMCEKEKPNLFFMKASVQSSRGREGGIKDTPVE